MAVHRKVSVTIALVSALGAANFAVSACGDDAAAQAPADAGGGETSTQGPGFGDNGDAEPTDAGNCIAPDMLIALDRTLTMHRDVNGVTPADTPDAHASSKWALAIQGIKQLVAPPLDQGIRFGLELWPKAEPGCITLGQRLEGWDASNQACEEGEVVVDTDLGTGGKIAAALDPEKTPICFSTPTGKGLLTASGYLDLQQGPGKTQIVALVTDGADWDTSCPDPNPLGVVDQLRAQGIKTIIVGFTAETSLTNGVGAAFLNDMACAGGMAKDSATNCVKNSSGQDRAKDPDAGPSGTLFYVATNPNELASSLSAVAKTVCCGCVK